MPGISASAIASVLKISDLDGAALVARDGKFLGIVSRDKYNDKSLGNDYTYGSKYNADSILNEYGTYGSKYSEYSPFNPYSSNPPSLIRNSTVVAVLTKNVSLPGAIDPNAVLVWIKDGVDTSFGAHKENVSLDIERFNGARIVARDGTFLGKISKNEFDSDSIANEFGFGNPFGSESLFNEFGRFGNKFSNESPFNEMATQPPVIVGAHGVIGVLTSNSSIPGGVSPTLLLGWLHSQSY